MPYRTQPFTKPHAPNRLGLFLKRLRCGLGLHEFGEPKFFKYGLYRPCTVCSCWLMNAIDIEGAKEQILPGPQPSGPSCYGGEGCRCADCGYGGMFSDP